MALTISATILGTTATVAAAGTSVDPLVAIPDNCHTVIIYNEDGTNTIYIGTGTAGSALTGNASVHVPPSSSITLSIGVKSERVGAYDFIYDASAGTNVIARITYVNGLSS